MSETNKSTAKKDSRKSWKWIYFLIIIIGIIYPFIMIYKFNIPSNDILWLYSPPTISLFILLVRDFFNNSQKNHGDLDRIHELAQKKTEYLIAIATSSIILLGAIAIPASIQLFGIIALIYIIPVLIAIPPIIVIWIIATIIQK